MSASCLSKQYRLSLSPCFISSQALILRHMMLHTHDVCGLQLIRVQLCWNYSLLYRIKFTVHNIITSSVQLTFYVYFPALCSRTFKEHCLVFLHTKKAVHRLRIIFGLLGLNATELHGNLSQLQVHSDVCLLH